MRLKKLITIGLTAVMAVSAMSAGAFAVDNADEVVYTYIDENKNEVNITRSELEAEHWNTDILNVAPFIYKDFPMAIDKFVNDYSDLNLTLTYLKKLDTAEDTKFTISDFITDEIIYTSSISVVQFDSPVLEMDKTYKLTLSETFDGITKEYYKIVNTSYEEAEMPEYVKNVYTDNETIILVGDVENLRASTIVDDEGNVEILDDMPRYEKIKACEMKEYVDNLPLNKLYRIYTKDNNNNRYFGFISTKGDINGIFMPQISISTWESINQPSPYKLKTPITASRILNGTKSDISQYRDYEFKFDNSQRDFESFIFQPPYFDSDSIYDININANTYVTVEIWAQKQNSATLHKTAEYSGRSGAINCNMIMSFYDSVAKKDVDLTIGDKVYFVIYFNTATSGEGSISIQRLDEKDDVTGSAFELYNSGSAPDEISDYTPYFISSYRDVDVFYLKDNGGSQSYRLKLKSVTQSQASKYNNEYTTRPKFIETASTMANDKMLRTHTGPDDIYTMTTTGSFSIRITSTEANKAFIYVSDFQTNFGDSHDFFGRRESEVITKDGKEFDVHPDIYLIQYRKL